VVNKFARPGPLGSRRKNAESHEPRTWYSSFKVLFTMVGLGAVGLVIIAMSVTLGFYLLNNADSVRAFWNRLLRRKAGTDKE
jgi:hypothetical protein